MNFEVLWLFMKVFSHQLLNSQGFFSVPYTCSGKLSKEKNFRKFHSFVVIHESFLRKVWGRGTFGAAKASN